MYRQSAWNWVAVWKWRGLLLCVLCGGCRPTKKDEKTEAELHRIALLPRVRQFNRYMRWKHFTAAKPFVHPKQQFAWLVEREKSKGNDNIVDLSMRDVTYRNQGAEAFVLVIYQRYRLPSTQLKREVMLQKWVYQDHNWFFVKDVEKLPPKLRKVPPLRRKPPIPKVSDSSRRSLESTRISEQSP
ncbi:MAG: hypothetical protein AAGJ35_14495 [Myxococcota bacterium]